MKRLFLLFVCFSSQLFGAAVVSEDAKREDLASLYSVVDFDYERDHEVVEIMFFVRGWSDASAYERETEPECIRKILLDNATRKCCGFAYIYLYNGSKLRPCSSLDFFIIDESLRGKGRGTFFLNKLLFSMKNDYKRSYFGLTSADDAVGFYKKQGFTFTSAQKAYCYKDL